MSSIAADLELSLAPTAAAPGRARRAVSVWLDGCRVGGAVVDVAVLLISELVTNAIRHASSGPNDGIRLTGRRNARGVHLAVRDAGTDGSVRQRPRASDHEAGGFGLQLVATLADAWGVDRDEQGTTVWLALVMHETAA